MQYRSQVDHTNNGPVEIVKAKVRDWRQRILARLGSEPAPESSVSTNRKPHVQVQAQPQNRSGTPDGPTSDAQAGATAEARPSSNPPLASTTSQPITAAGSAAAKPTAATSISNPEAAAKPSSAGAEEMAKAKNASDAAATAAWLWKATAKGNPDAPVQLADMYISGQGVPRSCEQAEVLLKTAAEKENARARNRLASMYATGTCVQRDRVQAYRWLSSALSANPNSDWAKQNRDLIWQQMTPEERAQAEKYR
jgi:TPR repeat protein